MGKVEEVGEEVAVQQVEVVEGEGEEERVGEEVVVKQAVEEHPASGVVAAAGYHRSSYGAPMVYDSPLLPPPGYNWSPPPRDEEPLQQQQPPQQQQPLQQPQQQQQQRPQPGPSALPAKRPAAQRLRAFVARASAERYRLIALLCGPKRARTKDVLEREAHLTVALLGEILEIVFEGKDEEEGEEEGEGQEGAGEHDVGSGEG